MLYRVTGSSRDTGARMILEIHAESKAAAERKALQQGMAVSHVWDITDGDPGLPPASRGGSVASARSGSMFRKLILLIVILAIVYAVYRYGIPRRASLHVSIAPTLFLISQHAA